MTVEYLRKAKGTMRAVATRSRYAVKSVRLFARAASWIFSLASAETRIWSKNSWSASVKSVPKRSLSLSTKLDPRGLQ